MGSKEDLDECQPLASEYHDEEPLCEHHENWHKPPLVTRILIWIYWVTVHITIAVLMYALLDANTENEAYGEKLNDALWRAKGASWCELPQDLHCVSFVSDQSQRRREMSSSTRSAASMPSTTRSTVLTLVHQLPNKMKPGQI
jgi:hypothetical protein